MGRCLGDSGGAAGVHLLAEHGDDLGAEQLDLLERHLHGQAHRVDCPELALVVAEPLLEGQGLLDHLLRTADAQRRARPEVIERVALTVDRRSLEVRAKPVDRVLRALGDERVPAEANDRLLRACRGRDGRIAHGRS